MSSRTRSRKQASIGSNHSLRRPTPISASEPRTGNFVLLLVMAWSPPAHNAGNVRVSAPGDYATFNSNHTPDGTMVRSELDKSFSRTSVTGADEQARHHTSESFGTRIVDQTDQAAPATRDSDTAIRLQQLSEARSQAEAQLSAILLSRSWRWTRPLRWIKTQWCELLLREPIG